MCGENPGNVFLLLFMLLRVPMLAMLCRRAVPMLWHASLFLGLRLAGFFPPYFPLEIGGFHCLFLERNF
jgi:hypothetical protein